MKTIILIFTLLITAESLCQNNKAFEGREFWLGYMYNGDPNVAGVTHGFLSLEISSQVNTPVNISIPGLGWSLSVLAYADSVIEVNVPSQLAGHLNFNVIENKGVHITSNEPISVTAINWANYSFDATPILPVEYLGNEYFTISYPSSFGTNPGQPEFLIVATEDNTLIEITPSISIDGHTQGVMYTIQLNKGQSYQNKGYGDITGTKIEVSASNGNCKPIAVFSGAQSVRIPQGCNFLDHMFEQVPPTKDIGKEYYLPPIKLSENYYYNILAIEDSTFIEINGGNPILLMEGDNYINSPNNEGLYVNANKKVYVAQLLTSSSCSSNQFGDPGLLILNPVEKGLKFTEFKTLETDKVDFHYVNIVINTPERQSIYLDNTLIPDSAFFEFEYDSTMSYANILLYDGIHRLESSYQFQANVLGLASNNGDESYIYGLGYTKDAPTISFTNSFCSSTDLDIITNSNLIDVWWSSFSNPQDTLYQGDTLSVLAPIIDEIYILNGLDSMSSCMTNFYFSVENSIPPAFSINEMTDTMCMFSQVQLEVSIDSTSNGLIEWYPVQFFDDPTSFNPIYTGVESGWIYASLTSNNLGCYNVLDSVYIFIEPLSNISSINIGSVNNTVCFGDTTELNLSLFEILVFDSFNDSINGQIWEDVSGGIIADSCGSYSGNTAYFYDSTARIIETYSFDLSAGGNISFKLKVGSGASPCDDAEFGDDIYLEYSINNGVSWESIATLFEYYYSDFVDVNFSIPQLAQTSNTKLRLIQYNHDGIYTDVWALDDFLVETKNSVAAISWSPNYAITDVTSYNPLVYPDTSLFYSVMISQGSCVVKDSIFINTDNFSVNVQSDSSCFYEAVLLETVFSDSDNYDCYWSSNNFSGLDYEQINNQNYLAENMQFTQIYFLNVVSETGCTLLDSMVIPPIQFKQGALSDHSMCIGDSILLNANTKTYITDDFNDATYNNSLWLNIQGGALSDDCATIYGNSLKFDSSGVRYAETKDFNTLNGCEIEFAIAFGSDNFGTLCGTINTTKYVRLYASNDLGVSWTIIGTAWIQTGGGIISSFTEYSFSLPQNLQSAQTRFKWEQNGTSFASSNIFSLENVSIAANIYDLNYSWEQPIGNQISAVDSLWVSPTIPTTYYLTVSDTLGNCQKTDSIFVQVGPTFNHGLSDYEICTIDSVVISPNLPVGPNYDFSWNSNSPAIQSTDSTFTVWVNQNNEEIAFEISSSEGCTMYDTITIHPLFTLENIEIIGDTLICNLDSVQLEARMLYQRALVDFDGSGPSEATLWNVTSGCSNLPACGSIAGAAKTFRFGGSRQAVTNLLSFYAGINHIEFYFKYGNGITCDAPEIGEEVLFEYSINGGANWITLQTMQVTDYSNFKLVSTALPDGITPATAIFRWIQPFYSGGTDDVWIIDNIRFSYLSEVDLQFSWFENGIPFGTDTSTVLVSPSSTAMYSVIIQDFAGLCLYEDSINVSVVDFTVSAGIDTTLCSSEGLVLQGATNAQEPYSITWNNSFNLDSITILTPTILNDSALAYVLEIEHYGCYEADTVVINDLPKLEFNSIVDTSVCLGADYVPDLTGAINIDWNPIVGITNPSSVNPVFSPLATTTYTVAYNDVNGCDYYDSMIIEVLPIPLVHLPSDTIICSSDSLQLITSSNVNNPNYLWNTNASDSIITIYTPGIYWVEIQTICGISRDSIEITQSTPLNINIEWSNGILSSLENNADYQWIDCFGGNLPIFEENDQTFQPTQNGSYAVILTNSNCTDTSMCMIINDVGVDENSYTNIKIVPNPTDGDLTITFDNYDFVEFEVMDMYGRVVKSFKNIKTNDTISIKNLSSGVYYLNSDSLSVFNYKIIKN